MGRTDGRDGLGMSAGLKSSPSDGQKNQEKDKHSENEHSDDETGKRNIGRIHTLAHTHTHQRKCSAETERGRDRKNKQHAQKKLLPVFASFAADCATKFNA